MLGDTGWFKIKRPTFSPCVCQLAVWLDEHAGRPAAAWLPISALSHRLRPLTGDVPLSEHNSSVGEIVSTAALTGVVSFFSGWTKEKLLVCTRLKAPMFLSQTPNNAVNKCQISLSLYCSRSVTQKTLKPVHQQDSQSKHILLAHHGSSKWCPKIY